MYDFAQFGLANDYGQPTPVALYVTDMGTNATTTANFGAAPILPEKQGTKTPKELYRDGLLNDHEFVFKTDTDYIQKQIKEAQDKLSFFPGEKRPSRRPQEEGAPPMYGGVKYGKQEIVSIIERLNNRLRVKEFEHLIAKYPHTTTFLVGKITKEHRSLSFRGARDFIPDFPSDAIKAMKEYDEMCVELCNKKTNFYVIAKNKDFEEKNRRRDPILLAQSPFGFFWQILGAWDEEMIYLGDL